MLVDDDRFLLDIYARKFKEEGIDTLIAVGAAEALKRLKAGEKPDAIVIDVIMPAISGLDLLERIGREKLAGEAKIVMLTNESDPKKKEEAFLLGAKEYIIKAATPPAEVVKRVRELISSAQ